MAYPLEGSATAAISGTPLFVFVCTPFWYDGLLNCKLYPPFEPDQAVSVTYVVTLVIVEPL